MKARQSIVPEKAGWVRVSQRLVFAEHMSELGTIFGGTLLSWLDESASLFSREQMGTPRVVTAAIERMNFLRPVKVGKTLRFYGKRGVAGKTSLRIEMLVTEKEYNRPREALVLKAHMVWVAVDAQGRPARWNKKNGRRR